MTIPEIKRVCYVGAGTMGCFNSLAAAVSGYEVVLFDIDPGCIEKFPELRADMAEMLVGGGYCTAADIAPALDRMRITTDLGEATRDADLVSESVFEQREIKRDIHRQLDEICPEKTILTTNSSALLVSDIEDVVRRGDRFAAMHSHLGSPLVDIVPGPRTDNGILDILRRYVLSTRGEPLLLKKEHQGYLLNAMLGPVLNMAFSLVLDGEASREQVDMAWMRGQGAAQGPFGMMDQFGLRLIYDTWQHRPEGEAFVEALRPRVVAMLKPYIENNLLGARTGRGFYRYPEPGYLHPDFLRVDPTLEHVYKPLQIALLGNGAYLAAHEVASPEDVDRAWTVGTWAESGPIAQLETLGRRSFSHALAAEVGAGRFCSEKANAVEAWLDQREGVAHG